MEGEWVAGVSVCLAAITKDHGLGNVSTTTMGCSQSRRLEVQDQGAGIVRSGEKPPPAADRQLVSSLSTRQRGLMVKGN